MLMPAQNCPASRRAPSPWPPYRRPHNILCSRSCCLTRSSVAALACLHRAAALAEPAAGIEEAHPLLLRLSRRLAERYLMIPAVAQRLREASTPHAPP